MRRIVLAAALSIFCLPALAQDSEIEGVISSQLEAFRADAFDRAFTYASPDIRNMFGTPGNFGRMVRNGYPMVHRPGDVRFGALEDLGGVQRQRVIIRDADGAYHALDYDMVDGPDGWKIDGVRLVEMPDVSV
ncbi:protein of unknown function [Palleronia marisminoris]|uniref:DUF4864 domain-containing protein n=1 Tax=Palleronia marisminoris TaxID=315423 RepID=A0A1Y5SF76_9RHOB|nr:DUF4864 domain-containing protein [Palleronia marisminoris]SFG79373.1 protein of unknown function [Palleronia marisminoris]SLN39014.1 hypothetical protein PAM7066_01646 [Palleronia marisminoris]